MSPSVWRATLYSKCCEANAFSFINIKDQCVNVNAYALVMQQEGYHQVQGLTN